MTPEQKTKCHTIIHSHAAAIAGANVVPVPGLGIAADLVAMTTMTMSLAGVFGGSLTKEAAKGLAVASMKRTILKQPIRTAAREISKLIPGLGQIVAPTIGLAMAEATGWAIAKQLSAKLQRNRTQYGHDAAEVD